MPFRNLRTLADKSHAARLMMLCGLMSGTAPITAAEPSGQDRTDAGQALAPSDKLEEVLVIAQRREERLQDVPIAVWVASAGDLEKSSVSNLSELSVLAPSFTWGQSAAWTQPHLRGVGTTASGPGIENSVALYVDGVYYAAQVGGNADFNNVAGVEVINGPQGTLFGRNATGGLIQIRTKDPSHDFGGIASASYGNYDTAAVGLYLTGGLSDNLAADIAIDSRYQGDGYGRNITTGADVSRDRNLFTRSKWLYTPSDALKVTLALDYGHVEFAPAYQSPRGTAPLGGGPFLSPYDSIGPINAHGTINDRGAALTFDFDAGAFRFLSITAGRSVNSETDTSPLTTTSNPDFYGAFVAFLNHRQISQEFQLASPGDGPLTWAAGAFYFREEAEYDPVRLSGSLMAPASDIYYYTKTRTNSYALYAQSTWAVQSDTNLTAGFRYTVEPRKIEVSNPVIVPPFGNVGPPDTSGSRTFESPSWRISMDHRFTDQILGYVSYNRGFKSGGWNPAQLPAAGFEPEKLDAYEIGIKMSGANNRWRLNLSPFLYKYKNMQVQSFDNGILLISNGATSELYGVDLDADFQVNQRLRVRVGASALHSEFTSYPAAFITTPVPDGGTLYGFGNVDGNRLPLAPDAQFTAAFDYTIPSSIGPFALNASYNYNDGWFAEPDNRLQQTSYGLVNARLTWTAPSEAYQIGFWGKNLGDERYATTIYSQSMGDLIQYAPPRTFGMDFKASF